MLCKREETLCFRVPNPFTIHQSWELEDPASFNGNDEQVVEKFREIRDIIETKVMDLEPFLNRINRLT